MNELNDLPHANEARRRFELGLYQKATLQMAMITSKINEAINNGNTTMTLKGMRLEPSVERLLKSKEYNIKANINNTDAEDTLSITW